MISPSNGGSNGPPRSPSTVSGRGRFRRLIGSERGTAIVEFALIAPILFLLVFGIVEFGRALNYYNDLTQLSGQGARAAVVGRNPDGTAVGTGGGPCPANGQTIQCQIAKTYPTDAELQNGISVCLGILDPAGSGNIQAPSGTPPAGTPITVRTKFTFQPLTSFFPSVTLTSTQTEGLEGTVNWTWGNVAGPGGGNACTP